MVFGLFSAVVTSSLISINFFGRNEAGGLDRFSWANIGPNQIRFRWAHLLAALVVIAFVCYTIYKELAFYVYVRICYFILPEHRFSEAANTILVTDIPEKKVPKLNDLYSVFPGGVRSIHVNRDTSALSRKMRQRQILVIILEAAETKLFRAALTSFHRREGRGLAQPSDADAKVGPLWRRYLDERDRDHIYLPVKGWIWMPGLPFFGKKVDIIQYCFGELARLNAEIREDQRQLAELQLNHEESSKYPRMKSAFVQFNSQSAAYMAR